MPEETVLQSKIPSNLKEKYLLDFLCARFKYQTKEAWLNLIQSGKVTVNGQPTRPYHPLKKGDIVAYSVMLQEPPVDTNIQILHEEDSFLVAVKPGNLPSHADGNYIKNTFIYLITQTLRGRGWEGEIMLVHRLDRETSGLMVVAKNKPAHLKLVRQFENSTIEKEYLAIVRGNPDWEHREVAGAIARDGSSQISIRRKVVAEGTADSKNSLTFFEKIRELKGAALVKCLPKTGRTNQIRVHLDSLGHPIIGDKLYGKTDEEFLAYVRHVKEGGDPSHGDSEVPRQFLHAAKLSLDHPETGLRVAFEAPLPEDMKSYLQKNQLL